MSRALPEPHPQPAFKAAHLAAEAAFWQLNNYGFERLDPPFSGETIILASHNVNTHFDTQTMETWYGCRGGVCCGAPLPMTFYERMSA
ncbi:hypothetical protein DSLASN_14540 [Desulfoluna limicola]|uniref:Uncharacterized protein n=1 Tax=Desulfoluna limicola TaxID=2810562 RepID=A0ABM7PDW3_9BACT|nr:hypothetical protein DSLASN_14540 [Desulfoluna limicola]